MHSRRTFYAFISPWLLGLVLLTLIPIGVTAYTSLTVWSGSGLGRFAGLINYRGLLHDSIFIDAAGHTLFYAAGTVFLQVVVAFVLASILNEELRGHKLFRGFLFIPYLVAGIPLYLIWTWLYNPNYGTWNYLLGLVHIQGPQWLETPHWAMISLILMNVTACGGMMLVFVAALQTVPVDLHESASMDGAGALARAWHITLPTIRPVVGFNVVWGLIIAAQVFAQPYSMTSGGPDYATEVVGLDLYQNAFQYFRFGYSSAMAIVMFGATLILSVGVMRFARAPDANVRLPRRRQIEAPPTRLTRAWASVGRPRQPAPTAYERASVVREDVVQ